MSEWTERRLGVGFGLLGGGLIVLAGLLQFFVGAVDMAMGRTVSALTAGSDALVLLVIGALALFFAYLGYRPWSQRPIVAGVLLVVTAAIGWGIVGLGASTVAFIGAIFVFLAGVLFLVEPMKSGISAVAHAA